MTCPRCWLTFDKGEVCPICRGRLYTWEEAVDEYRRMMAALHKPKDEQGGLFDALEDDLGSG